MLLEFPTSLNLAEIVHLRKVASPHSRTVRFAHCIHVVAPDIRVRRTLDDISVTGIGGRNLALFHDIAFALDVGVLLLADPHQEGYVKGCQISGHLGVASAGDALCHAARVQLVAHSHGTAFIVGDLLATAVGGVGGWLNGGLVGVIG